MVLVQVVELEDLLVLCRDELEGVPACRSFPERI